MFVRTLVTNIWGTATLANRSVTGRQCPRFKKLDIPAKPGLTPEKLKVVKGIWASFAKVFNSSTSAYSFLMKSVYMARALKVTEYSFFIVFTFRTKENVCACITL